jgi:probable HAF family extracellular repeat protein/T5SS/PEP-CTERM-associated repeat protein
MFLSLPGLEQRSLTARADNDQPMSPAAAPRYTITDLGTLGGVTTKAMGLNENGQVAGVSQIGSYLYGFLWDDGTMTNLGNLGGQGSWAYDVNESNQVVGGSPLGSGDNHAFLWQTGSGMQDLGTLGGPSSYAFEINNSGQVVGYACCAPDTYLSHAVLWGSGGIVDLGDLDPVWPAISAAYGLNDAGQVVGGSYNASVEFHAFLWQNGSMQDLGTLGGDYSSAEAINENGQVVGVARLANGTPHAFLWDGGMQDLGALTWDQSIAYDINDKGQVVGALQTGQTSHAFVWADGQMQDLNNLIPSDSGWVLQEARAINNKGRIVGFGTINGQTRAFLLKPNAYHWTNPSGGAWHLTTNWDPQGDPGAGDTVVFDLSGQYTVNASTLAAGTSPSAPQFSIDRLVISSTNFVYFDNMDLNMVYDSPEEPSLEVNEGGTAAVNSGAATFSHAIIGGEPPANPNNPPLARLQVLGNSASLTGSGRLSIGDEGAGELFVTAGGQLTSAEARIGGLLATGTGVADVGGDGSLWDTGNIAVGYGVSGTLTIQYGGRVNSNDAYVSWGALSEDSNVIVNSISANTSQPSMWALLGSLFVGQTWFGSVEVLDGGDLYVSQDVYIKSGELNIEGRHANGDPSDLDVLGSVFVGGAGSANLLALRNAAKGEIEGDLIIGKDGPGAAILWGSAVTTDPTWLNVVDPQAGLCVIGWVYDGGVSLDDGGLFRCRNIQLGQAGTSGSGFLTVDGGMVRALEVLTVGQVGGGSGVVDMSNNALVATSGTYITPNGVISGTGTLAVGFLGLQNDGTLAPGINMLYPLATAAAPLSIGHAQVLTGTLVISGTLTIGSTGRLEIPLIGSAPGQYGSLMVTGAVTLDGVLALDFSQGYAPHQGDTFTLLTATGIVNGAFDRVEISGLAPGFEYELTILDGQVTLEALNEGIPLRTIFLPLVRR